MNALTAEGLTYRYGDGTVGLEKLDLTLGTGSRTAILGSNGAGKSTFLLHCNGLLLPMAGTLAVCGVPVRKENLRTIRAKVGLVFQNPDDQLFCPSILEDVAFGLLNAGVPRETAEGRALGTLKRVGLGEKAAKAAHHLSLGERRRAALATVLVGDPELLVLDEPTANLDPRGRRELLGLLRDFHSTLVVATHNLEFAEKLCDRAMVMEKGKVAFQGTFAGATNDHDRLKRWGLV